MRPILFRGFHADENGKDKVFVNGEWVNGEWVYGYYETSVYLPCTIEEKYYPVIHSSTSYWQYEVIPSAVGGFTGFKIENKQLFDDDIIGIYTISYDDDDNQCKTLIAMVHVEFDETYQMPYAAFIKGELKDIYEKLDISIDAYTDYPIAFFIEIMDNSSSPFWSWEILGNIHSNPELLKEREQPC